MHKKERFVKSSGLNLWTQLLSNEKCSNVCLLISGAGASAMFWTDEFCRYLVRAGYSVIRFDHRDQGLSDGVDWDKNSYTIDDLAQDIIHILDAYDLKKAHIVGHSMGGIVAQWLAVKYSDRLFSYTSMSVATCGNIGQPSKEIMDVLLENKPTQNFDADLAGFMRSWEVLNGDYEVDKEIAERYTKDLYIRSKYAVGVAWHHIWCQKNYGDLTDKLKNINVPGLFIHGKNDPLIPLQAAIKTQKLAPHSRMIIIPGMGHMFFNTMLEKKIAKYLIEHFKG